jgi:hypothetical protein
MKTIKINQSVVVIKKKIRIYLIVRKKLTVIYQKTKISQFAILLNHHVKQIQIYALLIVTNLKIKNLKSVKTKLIVKKKKTKINQNAK